jgi:hypothetical protein
MSHISTTTGRCVHNERPASITVTPVFVADLHVEGERMPIYVHVIDRRSLSRRVA